MRIVLRICGRDRRTDLLFCQFGPVALCGIHKPGCELFAVRQINEIPDKPHLAEFGAVVFQNFRIIGDDRTVIVIIAKPFIDVIAHARVEDRIRTVFRQ